MNRCSPALPSYPCLIGSEPGVEQSLGFSLTDYNLRVSGVAAFDNAVLQRWLGFPLLLPCRQLGLKAAHKTGPEDGPVGGEVSVDGDFHP